MAIKKRTAELTVRHLQAQLPGLLVFECVARHMNFARAAADLMVTPTAVSKSIRQLEEQLGVRLFNRNTRSVALTESGQILLTHFKPALEQLKFSLTSVVAGADRPSGLLRITSSYMAYTCLIEPHVQTFLAQYPEIKLEISLDNSLVDIIEKGFDAGIRLGETIQRDMIAAPLGSIQTLVAVASPNYLEKRGTPEHPQELLQHNCIQQRLSTQSRFLEWTFQIDSKPIVIDVAGPLVVNEMRASASAAKNDIGIAYVFEQFVQDDIQSGTLKILLEQYSLECGSFYLYYPSNRQMPLKLRVFIDYMRSMNSLLLA